MLNSTDYKAYSKFIEGLAKKLTIFYFSKLNKSFKVSNKLKGRGYDPVTSADKAFEKFIRKEINKKFPNHQIIGEEFGHKKSKSEYSWVIDPIDGTRSFVIGNPTWSNLISLNYKGYPVIGLANFPILKKYYFNTSLNSSYVSEHGKKKKNKSKSQSNLFKDEIISSFSWIFIFKSTKKNSTNIKTNAISLFRCIKLFSFCRRQT